MAGEMKRTTLLNKNAELLGETSSFWDKNKRSESTILNEAKIQSELVTIYEDETIKTLKKGKIMVEDAFSSFDASYKRMIQREIDVEAHTKVHLSKLKDRMNQIAEALGKIEKLTGPDFETKLQRLERFANAVETLDRLNKTGKLAEVSASLGKLSNS